MGWLRNRTIRSYTKKAVRHLLGELDEVMTENPTLSYHDALKKIGTPISWNWSGEATTDLDRHVEGVEDDEYLLYTVVFLLARQWLLEELILNDEYPVWKEKTIKRETFIQPYKEKLETLFNNMDGITVLKEYLQHKTFPWNTPASEVSAETGIKPSDFFIELLKEKLMKENADFMVQEVSQ